MADDGRLLRDVLHDAARRLLASEALALEARADGGAAPAFALMFGQDACIMQIEIGDAFGVVGIHCFGNSQRVPNVTFNKICLWV